MNILHIDSSILGDYSVSRRLTAAVVARLSAVGSPTIIYRDVAAHPVPQTTMALANFDTLPAEHRSAKLVSQAADRTAVLDEVLAADIIVIGAPMYNFSVPSQLKAWIDALCIVGKTFQYSATGPKGLLGPKRVIIASSRGGLYGPETPSASFDHQETYLRAVFMFLGVTHLEIVHAEGLKISEEANRLSIESAMQDIAEMTTA